ncbi:hypothetical protein ACIP2X_06540 [Streptomyces sp. NPDC089424]|uniref:hypothetical protein n=1 Tax=Streptomyces sp. NPDC089424 TaxID=3365917 RepID=UPI0038280739
MTEEQSPWVGDQVYDSSADQEGIITDVKNGTYILRPVHTWARTWTAPSADTLEITVPRQERVARDRQG